MLVLSIDCYQLGFVDQADALLMVCYVMQTQFLLSHWSEQHEEAFTFINYLTRITPETDFILLDTASMNAYKRERKTNEDRNSRRRKR